MVGNMVIKGIRAVCLSDHDEIKIACCIRFTDNSRQFLFPVNKLIHVEV